MIRRGLALFLVMAVFTPALAAERVTVATQRTIGNGALFVAATRGYFKAEGLALAMRAYPSPRAAVEALADGEADFAITDFTAQAFALAGKGAIRAIAAQRREKRNYEGNELIASNAAYDKGLRHFGDLADKVIALEALGTSFHYQLAQLARIKHVNFKSITLKPLQSLDAVAAAVRDGKVDAAILPAPLARELLTASQAKLIGWVSEVDEPQLGALFASAKTLAVRHGAAEKFVRAYVRGAADYATALLRRDRYGKRVSDEKTKAAASAIARYVFPGSRGGPDAVEMSAYFMDPAARLDAADIARQVAWYKAQGLIDKSINARHVIDPSFTPAH